MERAAELRKQADRLGKWAGQTQAAYFQARLEAFLADPSNDRAARELCRILWGLNKIDRAVAVHLIAKGGHRGQRQGIS